MGMWSCGTPADCHNTEKWLRIAGNEFPSTGEMCPLRAPGMEPAALRLPACDLHILGLGPKQQLDWERSLGVSCTCILVAKTQSQEPTQLQGTLGNVVNPVPRKVELLGLNELLGV